MIERQGWGEIKEGAGAALVRVLTQRRGEPTLVRMADGSEFETFDGSSWGRDVGDLWEHVTAEANDGSVRFFYMSDVEALLEPSTRVILASQTPAPGQS